VTSLAELVASPTLGTLLGYVARPHADPDVAHVALIEDLSELERVPEQAIVLLTRGASAAGGSYRFDMALRLARSRRVAALVLSAGAEAVTPTAASIADRSGTAILATGRDVDLAELAIAIGRELAGGADAALLRAHAAVRAVQAHPESGRPEALVERAGAALGVPLRIAASEPEGPRAPIVVDEHVEGWVTSAAAADGDLALALDVVLHAVAAGVGRALAAARRAEELPIRSQDEVLTELLAAPAQARPALVQRARRLGVAIDGWHVAVRLELEDLAGADGDGEAAAYEARHALARAALQATRAAGGTWHGARDGLAPVLLRTWGEDPGFAAAGAVAEGMEGVLARLRPRAPGALIRCGVGGVHAGSAGLHASAAEAHAAVTAARAAGQTSAVVPFDSVGLRRTLVEWYATDTAREAVATVLAPLARLGGGRSERLIQTLHVYLDHQGSLTRTAETLNLHRNAVAYRIDKAFDLLDVDRDNPDDLLLLQLACRARELA
jgi:sugar diacid utilization regulator